MQERHLSEMSMLKNENDYIIICFFIVIHQEEEKGDNVA